MTSSSSRRFAASMDNPLESPPSGLPPDLAETDSWLMHTFMAERLLLPVSVARQVMMRLPHTLSLLMLAARWMTALVLAAGAIGVWLAYRYMDTAAAYGAWGDSHEWSIFIAVSAIVAAMALCHAAPRLAWLTRIRWPRSTQRTAAALSDAILCWRMGAFALVAIVCFYLL